MNTLSVLLICVTLGFGAYLLYRYNAKNVNGDFSLERANKALEAKKIEVHFNKLLDEEVKRLNSRRENQ